MHDESVLGRILVPTWGAAGSKKTSDAKKYEKMRNAKLSIHRDPKLKTFLRYLSAGDVNGHTYRIVCFWDLVPEVLLFCGGARVGV